MRKRIRWNNKYLIITFSCLFFCKFFTVINIFIETVLIDPNGCDLGKLVYIMNKKIISLWIIYSTGEKSEKPKVFTEVNAENVML